MPRFSFVLISLRKYVHKRSKDFLNINSFLFLVASAIRFFLPVSLSCIYNHVPAKLISDLVYHLHVSSVHQVSSTYNDVKLCCCFPWDSALVFFFLVKFLLTGLRLRLLYIGFATNLAGQDTGISVHIFSGAIISLTRNSPTSSKILVRKI